MQVAATLCGGLTELIRVAHYCAVHDVQFVPHHDPQIHGHIVCAFSNGFGVETFPNKLRDPLWDTLRSEEHTSELQSLMRNSYAVFCLKKKQQTAQNNMTDKTTTQAATQDEQI